MKKRQALSEYLEIGIDEVDCSTYDENIFDAGGAEYMVLTDEEADAEALNYIKESLWAFNASFLAGFTGLDEKVFVALQCGCEDSNDAVESLIKGTGNTVEALAEEAICTDGRGQFLNTYDGDENEQDEFFIYRMN